MSTAWIWPESASLCPPLSWEGLHMATPFTFNWENMKKTQALFVHLITDGQQQSSHSYYDLEFWGQHNRKLKLCLVHQTFLGVTVGDRVLGPWHHGSDLLLDPWCPSFPGQPLAAKESKFHWRSGMSHPPPWGYVQRLWVTAYMGWWWKVLSKD